MTRRSAELRPFFSFYGAKWRLASRYPQPKHDTIVEPFAGSAGYSVRHHTRKVILCDIDPVICAVWDYLIRVTPIEVLALPDVEAGCVIDDLKIPQEAKWLIGLCTGFASKRPRKTVHTPSERRPGQGKTLLWPAFKRRIAQQVDAIRHWEIHNVHYADAPAPKQATWFIDPPYQVPGTYYRFGSRHIDYEDLGDWCRTRRGQVIVCEYEGASWLPFQPFHTALSSRVGHKYKEVVWISDTDEDSGV